jgi:hypothetical protein
MNWLGGLDLSSAAKTLSAVEGNQEPDEPT